MNLKDIQNQISEIKIKWESLPNVPSDLTSLGFAGLLKSQIGDALGGLAELVGDLSQVEGIEIDPIVYWSINQTITNLTHYVNQHIPSNPQPHIPGFLALIEQLRQFLREWLESADGRAKHINKKISERLAEASSKTKDALQLYEKFKVWVTEVEQAKQQLAQASEVASQAKASVQSDKENAAKGTGEVSALLQQASEQASHIKNLVSELGALKVELEENKKSQEKLFGEFENYREKINGLLEDSNRTGIAAAFKTRKDELGMPTIFWAVVFIGSLVGLFIFAFSYLTSLTGEHWRDGLIRLPISGALVWLGWFSAKQYGYSRRLQEDYAYKVASAMSFEGYKREASAINQEMLTKLMETAIANFAENPLRIYEKGNNHASPLHELLDKGIADLKPTEILEMLSKVVGKN